MQTILPSHSNSQNPFRTARQLVRGPNYISLILFASLFLQTGGTLKKTYSSHLLEGGGRFPQHNPTCLKRLCNLDSCKVSVDVSRLRPNKCSQARCKANQPPNQAQLSRSPQKNQPANSHLKHQPARGPRPRLSHAAARGPPGRARRTGTPRWSPSWGPWGWGSPLAPPAPHAEGRGRARKHAVPRRSKGPWAECVKPALRIREEKETCTRRWKLCEPKQPASQKCAGPRPSQRAVVQRYKPWKT